MKKIWSRNRIREFFSNVERMGQYNFEKKKNFFFENNILCYIYSILVK